MKKLNYILIFLSILITPYLGDAKGRKILKIGAIPDQNPEKLNRLYTLLSKEIEKSLNIKVKYIPVTNYSAAVTAFRTGGIDLVWFGGLTGVQARLQKPGAIVIAQRDIDSKFRSVIISNVKANIPVINKSSDLKLLKGKRFTFGSESSTSGRLMPQYYLQRAGVKLKDFKGGYPGFSGSHDATIALVNSGSYQVGVLNKQVWDSNLKTKRIRSEKVKLIWTSPPYADYHWLAQPNLDKIHGKGFTRKLKTALLSLSTKSIEEKKILDLFGAKRFIPANKNQYQKIELIGRKLGKIN